MTFLDLINRRQSVRRYADKPVEREKIELCLEAARLAPSTSNSQPWKFIVVDEPQLLSTVAAETVAPFRAFNTFTLQAPVVVAVLVDGANLEANTGKVLRRVDYSLIDVGIATEHFCLQAVELGLGTCILGWFDEKAIKKLLQVPRNRRIYLMITLGYPQDDHVRPKRRKALETIRSYNRY
ncbi:MAG: nitroreductase family protein [Spirochaetaceae bacterium]|nr:MAG: nitroreductase family protein [Spirochaetaceae bacterium]